MTTMTEWQMQLLSDIFRLTLKELKSDDDKEKLAPGEMGISYKEGAFYVRNPHTGELFSPNSLEHLNQILAKYDSVTNLLNADKVSGVRFYSSISQLDQLGISLSVDTVIRQMEYPSILFAPITYSRYKELGYPSDCGIIQIHKVNPEFVTASYYDCNTFSTYEGKYNHLKNFFEGWVMPGGIEADYVESVGGGNSTTITVASDIYDLMQLSVRVTTELNPGATVKVNDLDAMPILLSDGTALSSTISANSIIMLVYDEQRSGWILLNSSESSVSIVLDVMNARITELVGENQKLKERLEYIITDYTVKINTLQQYINTQVENIKAAPGRIITVSSIYVVELDKTDTIPNIEGFNAANDKLVVNFNQTVLRETVDYIIEKDMNGIQLITTQLAVGDTLQFIVFKQPV